MEPELSTSLLEAVKPMMGSLSALLQEAGVGCEDFVKAFELIYFQEALKEEGARHKGSGELNVSHLSVVTRWSRRRVRAVADAWEEDRKRNPTARGATPTLMGSWSHYVMNRWCYDRRFSDGLGNPKALTPERFEQLCSNYCSQCKPATILQDLKRQGALERQEDGLLVLTRREYSSVDMSQQGLRNFGEQLREHVQTLRYNLTLKEKPAVNGAPKSPHTGNPLPCIRITAEIPKSRTGVFRREVDFQVNSLFNALSGLARDLAGTSDTEPHTSATETELISVTSYLYAESRNVSADESSKEGSPTAPQEPA